MRMDKKEIGTKDGLPKDIALHGNETNKEQLSDTTEIQTLGQPQQTAINEQYNTIPMETDLPDVVDEDTENRMQDATSSNVLSLTGSDIQAPVLPILSSDLSSEKSFKVSNQLQGNKSNIQLQTISSDSGCSLPMELDREPLTVVSSSAGTNLSSQCIVYTANSEQMVATDNKIKHCFIETVDTTQEAINITNKNNESIRDCGEEINDCNQLSAMSGDRMGELTGERYLQKEENKLITSAAEDTNLKNAPGSEKGSTDISNSPVEKDLNAKQFQNNTNTLPKDEDVIMEMEVCKDKLTTGNSHMVQMDNVSGDQTKSASQNTGKEKCEFLTSCKLKETEEECSRDSPVNGASITGAKSQEVLSKKGEEKMEDEPEFIWEKHLEETRSQSVPPTAFKHVEYSLESGFVKGMKLEVPNKCNLDTYWVASVYMTCGPLLRLRFDGYEDDNAADFWCDLMSSEIHPIGWCAQNNQILQPPESIKDKFEDWRDFLVKSLTGARTAPSYLLDKNTGITPIDQLKQGMRLELQHPINPLEVWLVKILENVGGRLYLRFEGLETATHDFWLFYLNYRLHPMGWAKTNSFKYQAPKELTCENSDIDWTEVLKVSLKDAEKCVLPMAIFKDQEEITEHTFKEGWKLEALNPINRTQICPATVTKVLNSHYFVVEIDDLDTTDAKYKIKFSCHSGSKCIFPVRWCHSKGVALTPPNGWPRPTLSWVDYLKHCGSEAAHESCFLHKIQESEFERGMKCEAVNPENPNQICVATVSRVIGPLLWVHLDNSYHYGSSHIEHIESHNLFPVGWCESNGYQIRPPVIAKKTAVVLPETYDATSEAYHSNKGGEWCPKVYYNHHCFSGPHLSKGRIASLPKSVGPGPINLVMKEVIAMLINVAYKPCRVLKELQLEGKPSLDMHQQTLKAKYKGKSYRAIVEICRHAERLPEFCKRICTKLECCPNLVSPTFINGECPEKCSLLTKTQYTYYNPKKKVGRPPGGHTNLENGPKKPGKKKKKRRMKILSPGETNGDENGSVADGDEDKESVTSDTKTVDNTELQNMEKQAKRKYVHHVPLPSEIRTRGAKLPKYSFERKTHKKIPIQEKQQYHHKHKKHHIKEETQKQTCPHISPVKRAMELSSNPLHWSVQEVVRFIKGTDCAPVARVFKEQEIDGQALLLLTLPTVQEYLQLKLGPAIKLCHHIEQIKVAFFQHYAK